MAITIRAWIQNGRLDPTRPERLRSHLSDDEWDEWVDEIDSAMRPLVQFGIMQQTLMILGMLLALVAFGCQLVFFNNNNMVAVWRRG